MKTLKDILVEGLFDMADMEGLNKEIDKDIQNVFLSQCKGKYNIINFKDGSCRINGKLIITGKEINDGYLREFKCRDFNGTLIIENCPNLTSLKDSFLSKITVFKGSLTINQCPALESLDGIPQMIDKDLTVSNCKKVKNLGTCYSVLGNIYWSHNGKKLSKDQILDKTHCIGRVFLESLDEEYLFESEEIFETFNNPWLQKLAKQLKKYPGQTYTWGEGYERIYKKSPRPLPNLLKMCVGNNLRLLDKIGSDEIEVFNMGDKKDKDDLKKLFYYTYNKRDGYETQYAMMMFVFDEGQGEFVKAYGTESKYGVDVIRIPNSRDDQHDRDNFSSYNRSKTETKDELLDYGFGYTVVAILNSAHSETGDDKVYKIQSQRRDAQEGMIHPGDAKQYEQIAKANIKRYKDILAKNRATMKNDKYAKLVDEVEAIMMRVFKLTKDITKNPEKYQPYDINNFLNWVRDEKRGEYKRGGYISYGEDGLMCVFRRFMENYTKMSGGDQYYKDNIQTYAKYTEQSAEALRKVIDTANIKLKKFGF